MDRVDGFVALAAGQPVYLVSPATSSAFCHSCLLITHMWFLGWLGNSNGNREVFLLRPDFADTIGVHFGARHCDRCWLRLFPDWHA